MTALLSILVIAILIGIVAVILYNGLVQKRQMTENGWSDVEVQLKRRADLIPRLVDTVKGYANFERDTLEQVIAARNKALAAGDDPKARGAAESALSAPTSRLLALAEGYPDLKSGTNFLELQDALVETEDKIEMARRFYNGAVREYNVKVRSVPSNLIAGPFGFRERDFFEIETASDRLAPDVSFN